MQSTCSGGGESADRSRRVGASAGRSSALLRLELRPLACLEIDPIAQKRVLSRGSEGLKVYLLVEAL